jgi:hypothetical protein
MQRIAAHLRQLQHQVVNGSKAGQSVGRTVLGEGIGIAARFSSVGGRNDAAQDRQAQGDNKDFLHRCRHDGGYGANPESVRSEFFCRTAGGRLVGVRLTMKLGCVPHAAGWRERRGLTHLPQLEEPLC